MFLENLVFDATDPQRLGRFWEGVVAGETLTDDDGIYETRLRVDGGPEIDLCFQQVAENRSDRTRIHLAVLGDLGDTVQRLADPEGNPYGVADVRSSYVGTGPIAAVRWHSADPDRDAAFWSWLTGWVDAPDVTPRSLRHPSLRGPLLELVPEQAAKGPDKNWLHLDVRLEPLDDTADEVEAAIVARGGTRLMTDWGDLPWRSYLDPSGNEFCVLPPYPATT
ncbi:VOC family protein [Nocardioides stalactiti]|uniref:VOC family protein n=1 Tax=Nocardioides stalactiti TaxID=2755356 RepID=UPI0015FEDCBA|nr:VOC family protein [Nocardioides stalactiti]